VYATFCILSYLDKESDYYPALIALTLINHFAAVRQASLCVLEFDNGKRIIRGSVAVRQIVAADNKGNKERNLARETFF